MILEQAVKQKASDVHLEPQEEELRVRFRIDGILRDIMVVPPAPAGRCELPHQDYGQSGYYGAKATARWAHAAENR